jgi:ribonuclease HII
MFSEGQSINAAINDSKKLSAKTRDDLYKVICDTALCYGVGIVNHHQIDKINILQATYLAMQSATAHCHIQPEFALVDGRGVPQLSFPARAVIKGDSLSLSIAAASIMAKVTRDRLMLELHEQYPKYGFAQHKGYPTQQHIQAIKKFGLSPVHRRSFHPKALEYFDAECV